VFAYFADHERFGRIWPGRTQRIVAAAGVDPNGLGSVRKVSVPFGSIEETITAFEPPRLIEYRVTRGDRVRNHLGRLEFESVPGGTTLHYSIEFDARPAFIGGLLTAWLCTSFRRGIHRAIEDISVS
jgi:uncharacterized protein YndB with AHSA1/START domain